MSRRQRVLVIDDEPDLLVSCERILGRRGLEVITAADGREGLRRLREGSPDLLLVDLRLRDLDGLEVMRQARELDPELPVIIITGFATIETAVEAMRGGAADYLPKPFSPPQLEVVVTRALAQRRLGQEHRWLKRRAEGDEAGREMIGESPALRRVLKEAAQAAETDATVLITGETGTGKEILARFIHRRSPRSDRLLVPIDCAALPDHLLESELFGHEKGAFTGAVTAKVGLLEYADGGTVLFDEIGALGLDLQAKLLRTLEEREFRRVGGQRLIAVDIRVLAATNRDLEEAARRGEFRQDLLYRLNVVRLHLPSLRERREDVPLLARHFLTIYGRRYRKADLALSPEVLSLLTEHPWPGNVRELENAIQRAVSLSAGGEFRLQDLPEGIRLRSAQESALPSLGLPYRLARERWIQTFGREYLTDLLARSGGNLSRAAREAGLDRKSLYRLLKRFGIEPPPRRTGPRRPEGHT